MKGAARPASIAPPQYPLDAIASPETAKARHVWAKVKLEEVLGAKGLKFDAILELKAYKDELPNRIITRRTNSGTR
jgi:hypothetical protein